MSKSGTDTREFSRLTHQSLMTPAAPEPSPAIQPDGGRAIALQHFDHETHDFDALLEFLGVEALTVVDGSACETGTMKMWAGYRIVKEALDKIKPGSTELVPLYIFSSGNTESAVRAAMAFFKASGRREVDLIKLNVLGPEDEAPLGVNGHHPANLDRNSTEFCDMVIFHFREALLRNIPLPDTIVVSVGSGMLAAGVMNASRVLNKLKSINTHAALNYLDSTFQPNDWHFKYDPTDHSEKNPLVLLAVEEGSWLTQEMPTLIPGVNVKTFEIPSQTPVASRLSLSRIPTPTLTAFNKFRKDQRNNSPVVVPSELITQTTAFLAEQGIRAEESAATAFAALKQAVRENPDQFRGKNIWVVNSGQGEEGRRKWNQSQST
jgi:hypothetical protein